MDGIKQYNKIANLFERVRIKSGSFLLQRVSLIGHFQKFFVTYSHVDIDNRYKLWYNKTIISIY